MGNLKSREWVTKHREELKRKFSGKTILVCGNEIVKVFEGAVDPVELNDLAKKICKKGWCYTYLHKSEEEYLL